MAGRARPVLGWRGVPLVAIAASALLLSGCDAASVDLIVSTPTPTHTPRPAGDAAPVGIAFAPLRGTPADAAAMSHPSIAVKIDNHEDARPQVGAEPHRPRVRGARRGRVHPLRRGLALRRARLGGAGALHPPDGSRRSPDRCDGIIAYSGGQQYFVDLMKATELVNIVFDEDDSLFERADDRPGPHDVILAAAEAVRRNAVASAARPCSSPTARPTRWRRRPSPRPRRRTSNSPSPRAPCVVGLGPDRVRVAQVAGRRARPRGDGRAGPRDERRDDARRRRLALRGGAAHRSWSGSGEVWVSAAGRTAHGTWSKADDGRADRAHGRRRQPAPTRAGQHLDRARAERGLGGLRALSTRLDVPMGHRGRVGAAARSRAGRTRRPARASRHPCSLALVTVECQNRL